MNVSTLLEYHIARASLIPPSGRPSPSRRWERRLAELSTLGAGDRGAPTGLIAAVRDIFEFLDRVGVDTDDLRIFLNQDGHFEIERRNGREFRTLEVSHDGLELHEVDLEASTAVTRRVESPRTAGSALMFRASIAA